MNQMLCSICCLSYNHEKFIEENIRSLWNQDYKNIEIIAIDDGSSDGSVALLHSLQKESPVPMKVVAQENSGNVGMNFNRAFKLSSGELVSFISMDDKLYEDNISSKIGMFDQDANLVLVVHSSITGIDDNSMPLDNQDGLEMKLASMKNPTADQLLEQEYRELHTFYLQGSLIRRTLVEEIGSFDEDMTGDDIVIRTKMFKHLKNHPHLKFEILKNPGCYYRLHDSNVHKNGFRQIRIIAEYMERFWPDRPVSAVFISWFKGTINALNWEDSLKLFSINKVTATLLENEEIKKCLLEKQNVLHEVMKNHATLMEVMSLQREMLETQKEILRRQKRRFYNFFLKRYRKRK